jgi:hypothetical protein
MNLSDLKHFLTATMNMTEVYQPVVIKALLLNHGQSSKDALAAALADYDLAFKDYYRSILMRWPKVTLSKHGIIRYERKGQQFFLNCNLGDETQRREAISICDAKIEEWIEKQKCAKKTRWQTSQYAIEYSGMRAANVSCAAFPQVCVLSILTM